MQKKGELREFIWKKLFCEGISKDPFGRIPPFIGQEKASRRLSELPCYREAKCIMVPPDEAQKDVRLSVLKDQKRLIMATPGLRDGFYLIDPVLVPSEKWPEAVSIRGVKQLGKRLKTDVKSIGKIDLLITGAVVVNPKGARIGKGSGFFDLEYTILRHIGAVDKDVPVVAVVHDMQVVNEEIPMGENDVPVDYIVTPSRIIKTNRSYEKPSSILWEMVKKSHTLRMRPLKEIRVSLKHKNQK